MAYSTNCKKFSIQKLYCRKREWVLFARQVGIICLLFGLSISPLLAQTKVWTGSSGTDWNTAGNWNPTGVPTATDNVTIVSGVPQPTIGAAVTALANSVEVRAAATLSIASAGSLSVIGATNTLTPLSYAFYNLGTVNNSGLLAISNATSKPFGIVNEAAFNNNTASELRIDNATYMYFWNRRVTTTPVLTNSGKITVGQSSTTSPSAGIYNETSIQNNTGAEIILDRVGSAYLYNLPNSTLTNSGTISIGQTQTNTTGAGIYNFGASQNLAGGTIKIDRTSSGIHNTTQTFSSTVNAPSSFTNAGKISIGQSASISGPGIYNISSGTAVVTFINTAGAEIVIDRTRSGAIHNENGSNVPTSFINAGKISVGQSSTVGGPGIYNYSGNAPVTFLNATGAEIIIDQTANVGIHTQNQSSTPTSFTNAGRISIGQLASTTILGPGIGNYSGTGLLTFINAPGAELTIDRTFAGIQNGLFSSTTAVSFNNAGPIKIGTTAALVSYFGSFGPGISSYSPFINQATGTITIERVNQTGIYHTAHTFTNNGTITIGISTTVGNTSQTRPSVFNSGTFVNGSGAVLLIDRTPWSGVHNSNNALLTNAGLIDIGKNVLGGANGFFANISSTVTNGLSGTINVDHVNGSSNSTINGLFVYGASFTNAGKITIGSSSSAGNNGLYNDNSSNFTNSGEISIDHAAVSLTAIYGYHGLRNDNIFTNTGKINIGSIGSGGNYGLWNDKVFTNNTGGEITINRSAIAGLRTQGFSTTFTNGGSINIGNITSTGDWGLWNGATFTNSGSGAIKVDRSTGADLVNGSSAGSGTFTNGASASLSIGTLDATAENGLYNHSTSTFSNSACATLTLYNNLDNLGTFSNQGIFILNTSKAHSNPGFTNNGVLDYLQVNPIPNVTNNDLLIVPISSSCSVASTSALQFGGSNSFSVATTWYKDAALTQPAGTYDPGTNTFTPTALDSGSNLLWFLVTDNDNNCSRTAAISVQATVSGSTASIQSLSVSGALGNPTCAVQLTGRATGSVFTFTGPDGYVFSNVYRNPGTYNVFALKVIQPGVYTLTANAIGACGLETPVTQTITVGGTKCP